MTEQASFPSASVPARRIHRWLALVPPVAMLGGIPFANHVEPYVLGLPFLLFWVVLWVVLTGPVMGLIFAVDAAATRRDAAAGRLGDAKDSR
jgi:uncharacterized protein DUF3311